MAKLSRVPSPAVNSFARAQVVIHVQRQENGHFFHASSLLSITYSQTPLKVTMHFELVSGEDCVRCSCPFLILMGGIGLGAKAAGGRARLLEVATEGRDDERTEDELGTTKDMSDYKELVPKDKSINLPEGREREPQKENKLEGIVEGEPVNNADKALKNGEERENNPVLNAQLAVTWGREKARHIQSTIEYHRACWH